MQDFSISKNLINLTKSCVEESKGRVRIENEYTDGFNIKSGLRQGGSLASLIFYIALEATIRKADISIAIFTGKGANVLLAYADGIDVICINVTKTK